MSTARVSRISAWDATPSSAQTSAFFDHLADHLAPVLVSAASVSVSLGVGGSSQIDLTNVIDDKGQGPLVVSDITGEEAEGETRYVDIDVDGETVTVQALEGELGSETVELEVRNSHPVTRSITLTLAVTVAEGAGEFSNGYSVKRRLIIPSWVPAEKLTRFPLLFGRTETWLKTVGNGGALQSGDDLRFEDAAGSLAAQESRIYVPTTGEVFRWVQATLQADQQTELALYYDAAIAATLRPDLVWQDYEAVWDLGTGADRSGNGRDLTAIGTPTADGELGAGVVVDAADGWSTDDLSWLGGLTAIAVQIWSIMDVTMQGTDYGFLHQTSTPDDISGGVDGFRSGGIATTGAGISDVARLAPRTSAGVATTLSDADRAPIFACWHSHIWQSGVDGQVFQNDINLPLSYSLVQTGGIVLEEGSLYVLLDCIGTFAEMRVRASAVSLTWHQREAEQMRWPKALIGVGDAQAPGDAASCVALPQILETEVDAAVAVDLLTGQVGTGLSVDNISATDGSVGAAVAGVVTFTPDASFQGLGTVEYRLVSTNGSVSWGWAGIRVGDVDGSGAGVPTGEAWSPPTATRVINVSDAAGLTTALSNAQAGDSIELANGTYGGTFVLSVNGTENQPIVIRAKNANQAVLTGTVDLNGTWNVLWQCRNDAGRIRVYGNDSKVMRCSTVDTGKFAIGILGTAKRVEIAYNDIDRFGASAAGAGRGISVEMTQSAWPTNPWIHHNHLHDQPAGVTGGAIHAGSDRKHTNNQVYMLSEYNLVERCPDSSTILGMKCSNNTHQFNTVRDCPKPSQSRHGRNCKWLANAFINSAAIRLRGVGHEMIGNYKESGGPGGSNLDFSCASGSVTEDAFPTTSISPAHPAAEECLCVGNIGPLWIGGAFATDPLVKAKDNTVEAHSGSLTLVSGREVGTTVNGTTTREIPQYVILNPADVGLNADL